MLTAEDIVSATRLVYDPTTPTHQRNDAQVHLEHFRQKSPPDVIYHTCVTLFQPDQPLECRHFALSALETLVKTRWQSELSLEFQNRLKSLAFMMIDSGTRHMLDEPLFIKERIAILVSAMAKRCWPQMWDDFLDTCFRLTLGSNRETQRELVLLCLRRFAEDVFVYNEELSEERRTELTRALHAVLSGERGLLQCLLNIVSEHYTLYCNSSHKVHEQIVNCGLSTVNSFLDIVPLSPLVDAGFPNAIHMLMCNETFRGAAVECASKISSKKLENQNPALQRDMCTFFESVRSLCTQLDWKSFDDETFKFLKGIAELVCSLGMSQYSLIFEDDSRLVSLLQLSTSLLLHPSVTISSNIFPLFLVLMKEDKLTSRSCLAGSFPTILRALVLRLLNIGDPSFLSFAESESPTGVRWISTGADFNDFDFDSPHAYLREFTAYRNRLMDLIRRMVRLYPNYPTAFLSQMWMEAVKSIQASTTQPQTNPCVVVQINEESIDWKFPNVLTSVTDERGVSLPQSPALIVLEGLAYAINAMTQAFPESKREAGKPARSVWTSGSGSAQSSPRTDESFPATGNVSLAEAKALLQQLLGTLLEFKPRDPMLVRKKADVVGYVAVQFGDMPAVIIPVMNDLFVSTTIRLPSEAEFDAIDLCDETVEARKSACSAILAIAGRPEAGDVLLQHLEDMFSEVKRLMEQKVLGPQEEAALCEALVLISNRAQNAETRVALLRSILDAKLQEWGSQEFRQALQTPKSFTVFLGMTDNLSEQSRGVERTRWMMHSIELFSATTKCSQRRKGVPGSSEENVFLPIYTGHVLPGLCEVIRVLHSLWMPEGAGALPADMTDALQMSEPEIAHYLQVDLGEMRAEAGGDHANVLSRFNVRSYPSHIKHKQSILRHVRASSYALLRYGAWLGPPFFATPGLGELLRDTLFRGIENTNTTWHLTQLITGVVQHLVLSCPAEYFSVLDVSLPGFIFHLYHLLPQAWADSLAISAGTITPQAADSGSVNLEIVREHSLRALTRRYLQFLLDVLTDPEEERRKGPVATSITPVSGPCGDEQANSLSTSAAETKARRAAFRRHFFSCENMISPALATARLAICWPDTDACRLALQIFAQIINLLQFEPKYVGLVFDAVLESIRQYMVSLNTETTLLATGALSGTVAAGATPTDPLQTLVPILLAVCVREVPNVSLQLLMQLPNVTEKQLQTYFDAFRNCGSEKRRRALTKQLLQSLGTEEFNTKSVFSTPSKSIPPLPQSLSILKKQNSQTPGESWVESEIDLGALFRSQ
eukprot:Rmarinus@m.8479